MNYVINDIKKIFFLNKINYIIDYIVLFFRRKTIFQRKFKFKYILYIYFK